MCLGFFIHNVLLSLPFLPLGMTTQVTVQALHGSRSFEVDHHEETDGLIIQHHIEVRDAADDLAALVWGHVVSEPVVIGMHQ